MSRALKFRAWDKEEKEYYYDVEHTYDFFCSGRGCYAESFGEVLNQPDRFIVEQFTGLLDRNGKKIYEGDIFRNAINGGTWRVYWTKKDAAFWVDSGVAGCSLGEFDWDRSNRKYGFIRKNCEIVGNIHENPELLEVSNGLPTI